MQDFTPFIIQDCLNIASSIQQYCKDKNIEPDDIFFKIQTYKTFIQLDSQAQPHLLTQDELERFDDDVQYNKEGFRIYQSYTILVMPKIERYLFDIECSDERVDLVFDEDFIVIDHKNFNDTIQNLIESTMAYNGIILRQIQKQRTLIQEILAAIKQSPLQKTKRFCIKQSFFRLPQEMRLDFFPLQKWEKEHTKSPPNSVFGVMEGECIATLYLPDSGQNGRNLKGVYIYNPPKEQKNINVKITFDENEIQTKIYPNKIEYFSKIKGYVGFKNGAFSFWKNHNNAFKKTNTPNLLGGLHLGLAIHIISKDTNEDAIGDNMQIEADEIHIIGYVGKDTILKANHLLLNGATHQSTKIIARTAKILTFKGYLECEKCAIRNLDSGNIKADIAKIIHANGGTIYARQIQIQALKTNNKIFFSNYLHINENKGIDNALTICINGDTSQMKNLHNKLNEIDKQSQKSKKLLAIFEDFLKHNQKCKIFLEKLQGFDNIQKQIFLKNPQALEKYHLCQYYRIAIKTLKIRILEIQQHISDSQEILSSIEDGLKDAKIIINSSWKDNNYAILECGYPPASDRILLPSGVIQNIGVNQFRTNLRILI